MARILKFPDNRNRTKGKVLMKPNPYTIKNHKRK